jgi:outer membrane protein assembly factor BamC
VLPAYGFTIKDTQQSLGWIDVEYDEPDSEFWKAKGAEPFKLEEDKYRFQLGEMTGGKTSITLFDKDKKPVASGVISQMYISLSEAFAKGLADQGRSKHGNRASRPCFVMSGCHRASVPTGCPGPEYLMM